jgi:hypothetical protein
MKDKEMNKSFSFKFKDYKEAKEEKVDIEEEY